jgi:hypothetical protein
MDPFAKELITGVCRCLAIDGSTLRANFLVDVKEVVKQINQRRIGPPAKQIFAMQKVLFRSQVYLG